MKSLKLLDYETQLLFNIKMSEHDTYNVNLVLARSVQSSSLDVVDLIPRNLVLSCNTDRPDVLAKTSRM